MSETANLHNAIVSDVHARTTRHSIEFIPLLILEQVVCYSCLLCHEDCIDCIAFRPLNETIMYTSN